MPPRTRRFRKRAPAAKNKGRTAKAVRDRNTNIATTALRIAKSAVKQQEIFHYVKALPALTFNNASAWTSLENGTQVNMTTQATANGWLENYAPATPCTGIITIPIAHFNQETNDNAPGFRTGNELFLRSVWLRLKLSCNTTTNSIVKLMLLKVKGKLSPESLAEYTSPGTPDFMQFQSKHGSSIVSKVLYNKIIKLDNFNHDGLQQERYISIYKKLNTKYFYRAPTEGDAGLAGDPDGQHDIGLSSPNYYFVIMTNTSTSAAVGVSGNMLTNYTP